MCGMVSNGCSFLGDGVCNFVSGGWEQFKIIGEIAKQTLFLNRSGVTENFSNLNLAGKITAVAVGACVIFVAVSVLCKCAEQSSKSKEQ